jgi:hypothetical protein
MQVAMTSMWAMNSNNWAIALEDGVKAIKEDWDSYVQSTPILDEEMPDITQMLVDAIEIFRQAFVEFEPWKYEVLTIPKKGVNYPALELHFVVPCPPSKGLHGYIDAILRDKETGFIWCTDYKFRKSLSPDDEEAYNIQNAVYTHACAKMGINITGTMTWQHVNTPASDPQILKNRGVSRAKIKTTWEHFKNFCIQHDIDPAEYEDEMVEKLADIEWFRATYEYRNDITIDRIWKECIIPATRNIKIGRGTKPGIYRSMYPWNCKMCQYQSLCQAGLRGYDERDIIQREYTRRGDNKVVDTPENSVVQ